MEKRFNIGTPADSPVNLPACLAQVEASKAWFTRRVLPLSIEQLRWRPDPLRWSIAECLDHLNTTLGLWLPRINAAVVSGRGRISGLAPNENAESEALREVEPPVITRTTAPAVLLPAAAVDPDQLVDCFFEFRDRYAAAAREVSELDWAGIRLVEPVAPCIHSVGGTLAFLAAHERRHLWQSERVRNSPRFPSGA